MSGRIKILSAIVLGLMFTQYSFLGAANAVTVPSFPACTNPQGEVSSSYSSGIHGVPGDSNTYVGNDIVYSQGSGNHTQCLCTENGSGTQTNWLSIPQMSQEEIDELVNDGWIYIQNGANWGLDANPYLAKNFNYTCTAVGGSSSENSSGGTGGPDGSTSSINSYLSLASTGNIDFIAGVLLVGLSSLALGFGMNLRKN